jgi:hypothetical protein
MRIRPFLKFLGHLGDLTMRLPRQAGLLALSGALQLSVSLALLDSFADAQWQQGECYAAQETACTPCVSTGGWWQCAPLLSPGHAEGHCGNGNRSCQQLQAQCSIKYDCATPPNQLEGTCSTQTVSSCKAQ